MRKIKGIYILTGVLVVLIPILIYCWFNPVTTIILVRHAEKASSATNTNLSADGLARAQTLVATLKDAGVNAIYATEYCRTAQTAQPLAQQLGLPLTVQENSTGGDQLSDAECEPDVTVTINRLPASVNTIPGLAAKILSTNAGKVVAVVGHSNTVPQLIEALGAPPLCPDYFPSDAGGNCYIPDDEFNHLFIVTKRRYFGTVRIVKAKYGG